MAPLIFILECVKSALPLKIYSALYYDFGKREGLISNHHLKKCMIFIQIMFRFKGISFLETEMVCLR